MPKGTKSKLKMEKFWNDFGEFWIDLVPKITRHKNEGAKMTTDEKLIGIGELRKALAKKLGYTPHPDTIYKAIPNGFPAIPDRLKGYGYRFLLSAVVAWLEAPKATETTTVPVKRGPGRPRKYTEAHA